jgi:MFS family permease
LNYIAMYFIVFLMPFYLQQGRGLNPAQAGLLLTAQPLAMAVSAPISGALSDRVGSRWLSLAGMLLMATGLALLSLLGPDTSTGQILLSLAVAGLGTGIFIAPNNNSLFGAAPKHRQGIASGVQGTARVGGMVLGVGLAGAILTTIWAGTESENVRLFEAMHTAFLVGAGVAVLGALAVLVRSGKVEG